MNMLVQTEAATEQVVHIGLLCTITIMGLVGLLIVWILVLRVSRDKEEARRKAVVALWRPLLSASLIEDVTDLPPIQPRDMVLVMYLWNHMQESIKGDMAKGLNDIASRVGMDRTAHRYLVEGRLREQLIAVSTLGHLRNHDDWDTLVALAGTENAFLSLAAARALVQIDATKALGVLVPLISHRSDWSPLKIITMLTAAGADVAAKAVGEAAVDAPPVMAARLIRYLAATKSPHALPPLRTMLTRPDCADEVIAACLHVFGLFSDPRDLTTVRRYLDHPTWFVRLQAAISIGAMGMEEDEPRLLALLQDDKWWVRYRAAEALVALPSMTLSKLLHVQAATQDEAIRDVLKPFIYKLQEQAAAQAPPLSVAA
ncbi:MAG: HEAT repeat domain-containing protein [Nitrospiraceae bacterium]